MLLILLTHQDVIHAKRTLKSKMLLLAIFALVMCGTVLTKNIILFFVGVELLGIISAIFVSLEKHNQSATSVYAYNMFASLLFLYGILNKNTGLGVWCLLISCLCKSAQFPFSGWLLQATNAHTFVSIFIHCATIIGIAPICIYKFNYLFSQYSELLFFTTIFGLVSAIILSLMALFEIDIKKIMAMLTISSAGIMLVACGLKHADLGLLYFICHAFFKSITFLLFYYYIDYYKTRDVRKYVCSHGTKILGLFALFSSIGISPFVGSYAKLSIDSIGMPTYCKVGVILTNTLSDAVFIRLYLTCFKNKNIGQKFKLYSVWILFIVSLPTGYIAFYNLSSTVTNHARGEMAFTIAIAYLIARLLPIKQINFKMPNMSFKWLINSIDYFNKLIEFIYFAVVYKNPYKIGNRLAILHKNSFRMHAIWIFSGFVFLVLYVLVYNHD